MSKRKVRITNTGYLPDSPDRHNAMNIIPSNQITMKEVPFPILGIDNLGNKQTMMPGGEYSFPGDYVTEIPMGKYQEGGNNFKTKLSAKDEEQFKKFFQTLPDNLRVDDSMYDIRGYWDASGRPEEFDYSQPTEEDGYYHAFSRHPETGKILKAPTHPTFKYAVDKTPIGDDTYVPLIGVDGNVYMRDLNWDSQGAFEEDTYKYQKGREVVYTDPEEFKIANQAYQDSTIAAGTTANLLQEIDRYNRNAWGNAPTSFVADAQHKNIYAGINTGIAPVSYSTLYTSTSSTGKQPWRVGHFKRPETKPVFQEAPQRIEPLPMQKLPVTQPQLEPVNLNLNTQPQRSRDVYQSDYTMKTGQRLTGRMRFNPESKKWESRPIDQEELDYYNDKNRIDSMKESAETPTLKKSPGVMRFDDGGIYLGKYEFKDGGLVKAADGIETNFRRNTVDKSKVLSLQKELKNAGYDLGKSGKSKDGVDGVWGPKTEKAYRDFTNKKVKTQAVADSTEGPIFSEEGSIDFNQQLSDTSSTLHNKALNDSLPKQAQENNIVVTDIPEYTESGLAVDKGSQSLQPEDAYLYEITDRDYSIPENTLNPDQFYYQKKIATLELPDGRTVPYTETVPSHSIMTSASDVTYNPIEKETQALTEGTVEKLDYVLQKNAPNLYRDDGTACMINGKSEERCAAGYQLGLDLNFAGKLNRKDLGITGDSWEVGQNIIDKGGSRVYGLTNDLDITPTDYDNKGVKKLLESEKKKRKIDAQKISNDAQVGDVVEMWYKDSGSQDEALSNSKGNTLTTHSGLVTEKDGVKYVTHNIHGTWHTDKLEDVINGKRKYMASGIVRPNYKVDENALGVKVSDKPRYMLPDDKERGLLHEDQNWKTKQTENGAVIPAQSTEANNYVQGLAYYAPQVQQDFKLSDNETSEIMKLAFGVYGKESGFSHGEEYTIKRKKRKIYKLYKDIAPDWMFEGDEMSSGPSQIKVDTNFNTDAEKALLAKYGVDDKNIWDEKNAAAATLLETARNYERFKQAFGVGFDNMDPITMRNILALAHNKGIDNVLKNEFTDISQTQDRNTLQRAYDYITSDTTWTESKLKGPKRRDYGSLKSGLEQYANIHKNSNSYSNLVQDYSQSLDVDYNKVKSNYWNTKVKPREDREHYDYTDWLDPSFAYEEAISPAINEAEEVIDKGTKYLGKGVRAADRKIERGLKALEKRTRGAVNKVKKKVRMQDGGIYMGTYEFKDGGLVKAQEGGSSYFFEPTYIKGDENEQPRYEPTTKNIYYRDMGSDAETNAVLEHEKYHWLQDLQGRMHVNTGQGPVKRPTGPITDEHSGHYYNRLTEDANQIGSGFIQQNPSFQFAPEDVVYNNYINPVQYMIPWTTEGEARQYENYIRSGGKSMFKKQGGLVKAQDGKEMPLDLPLKEQNVYLVPEYNQPINPKTGEILPDPQRPNLGMDTGATEYKYTYGSNEGDIDVPSIVAGQYIGDQALDRYMLTGERFKTMNDPGSYSKFYDQIGQLGLMQEKNGGSVRKVKIKRAPRKNQ